MRTQQNARPTARTSLPADHSASDDKGECPGGIVKRSLAMVLCSRERTIAKACGLDDATGKSSLRGQNV